MSNGAHFPMTLTHVSLAAEVVTHAVSLDIVTKVELDESRDAAQHYAWFGDLTERLYADRHLHWQCQDTRKALQSAIDKYRAYHREVKALLN